MISICFNCWANLCILARIQGLITISLKAINSTLTIQEIPRPTAYRIVVQTLRSSRPFFKGLSFLIHLTKRSSTLNPFPLLRKNWRLNYWVNVKTVHKSFHLSPSQFSSIDVKQLLARSSRRPNLSKAPIVSVRSLRHFFFLLFLHFL